MRLRAFLIYLSLYLEVSSWKKKKPKATKEKFVSFSFSSSLIRKFFSTLTFHHPLLCNKKLIKTFSFAFPIAFTNVFCGFRVLRLSLCCKFPFLIFYFNIFAFFLSPDGFFSSFNWKDVEAMMVRLARECKSSKVVKVLWYRR